MKKSIIIGIITAIAIPVIAYAAGPLFINTTIDEPAPVVSDDKMGKDNSMDKDPMDQSDMEAPLVLTGNFVGVGDGIHDAQGSARVIPISEKQVLRFEDFRSTNGPDLYVYLSSDNSASDFVNLGRLKANIGNQNYDIPEGTDLSKYDTVLIWCQQFSVLFGSAALESS